MIQQQMRRCSHRFGRCTRRGALWDGVVSYVSVSVCMHVVLDFGKWTSRRMRTHAADSHSKRSLPPSVGRSDGRAVQLMQVMEKINTSSVYLMLGNKACTRPVNTHRTATKMSDGNA